jgi:hypothetical protein
MLHIFNLMPLNMFPCRERIDEYLTQAFVLHVDNSRIRDEFNEVKKLNRD